MKTSIKEAVKFHGHLGPYLVLGLLAGEFALKKLRCKKYFGLEVKVWGATKKPKSCLIDGLQLSTGATYGKGNIRKFNGPLIKVEFLNRSDNRVVEINFKKEICNWLDKAITHRDSEILANKLYKLDYNRIFNSKLITQNS